MLIYAAVICAVLCACALLSRYLFQLTLVQGESMEPAYRNAQFVVINKYKREYSAGQVILFRCDGLDTYLIKRIVACSGDTVIIKNRLLYVNGKPLEDYDNIEYAGIVGREITIPESCYFVLGDNISESKDSRYDAVGIVNDESICGFVIGSRKTARFS